MLDVWNKEEEMRIAPSISLTILEFPDLKVRVTDTWIILSWFLKLIWIEKKYLMQFDILIKNEARDIIGPNIFFVGWETSF